MMERKSRLGKSIENKVGVRDRPKVALWAGSLSSESRASNYPTLLSLYGDQTLQNNKVPGEFKF